MVNWRLLPETSLNTQKSLRKPKLMLSMSRTSTMNKSRSTQHQLLKVNGSPKIRRNKSNRRRTTNLLRILRDPLKLSKVPQPYKRWKRNPKCLLQNLLRIASPKMRWNQRLRPKLQNLIRPFRTSLRRLLRLKLIVSLNQKTRDLIKSHQLQNRKNNNLSQKTKTSTIRRLLPLKSQQLNPQVTIITRNITTSTRNNIIIKAIRAVNTKNQFNHWPNIKTWSKVPKKRTKRPLRKSRLR